MFLISCKGRGYFNGKVESYKRDYNHPNDDDYNDFIEQNFKFKFKRDYGVVKSVYSYPTKEDAEKCLLELNILIQDWIDRGEDWTEERKCGRYDYGNRCTKEYMLTEHHHTDSLKSIKKIMDNLEIVEVDSYMAPKRTKKQRGKRDMTITHARSDECSCDVCQITLVKGEPYFAIQLPNWQSLEICRNCVFTNADRLEVEYNKHPRHEDITASWTLEKLSQES